MQTIQPKIPEIPGGKSNGTEIPGRKLRKIWVYLAMLWPFPEIPENAVHSPIQTGNFGQTESAPRLRKRLLYPVVCQKWCEAIYF